MCDVTPPRSNPTVTARLLRPENFQRVLGVPACARTAHFSLHFLAESPSRAAQGRRAHAAAPHSAPLPGQVASTRPSLENAAAGGEPPTVACLGWVVPKRHARRAATRQLIKRQMRVAMQAWPLLRPGLWVLRLRTGWDRSAFLSAQSEVLNAAVRTELQTLLARADRSPVEQRG